MEILSFEVTAFLENCYVMRDGGEALIIDPGDCNDDILAAIEGHTVNTIVNTHCHIDHVGGNGRLKDHTGAALVCPEGEVPLLQALPQQAAMFGMAAAASPMPDGFIAEGDKVTVGSVTMNVLSTPGHSPDHIVLVGDGFVMGGDVLFQGSIGRTDLPGGDHDQLLESIRTKLWPLPDDTVVYCGHGPTTTIGAERQSNPFLQGL